MVEAISQEVPNKSWSGLQVPENYSQMNFDERGKFLTEGIDFIADKMMELNMGVHVSGNVRLMNKLITTPLSEKASIPENNFDEAGIGFEYLADIFTFAWNYSCVREDNTKPSDLVNETERDLAKGFLRQLHYYLNSKYNK